MQASVLIGAALGYAVARNRGGSELVGVALGAFAGGITASAFQYARILIRNANGSLGVGYELSARAALGEADTFSRENIPVIDRRAALLAELDRPGAATRPTRIVGELNALKQIAERQTIPSEAYSEAAKTYPEVNSVMPSIPDARNDDPILTTRNEGIAEESAEILMATVNPQVAREQEQFREMQRRGLIF